MDRRVANDAVALADGVVEAGQAFAARGGFDPEAELADLNGFGVEVHAVEVVLEDLAVEVKEGALAAQFLQPGVKESDVQPGVAFVNGAEQAAEVEPDGPESSAGQRGLKDLAHNKGDLKRLEGNLHPF